MINTKYMLLGKYYCLVNLSKILFWIHFHYTPSDSIFSLTFGFDPYPKYGWINNHKMVLGFSLKLLKIGKLFLEK
jgi:hypothetical protein